MKKETLYTYLGTNGTLTTPIHLEGIYAIKKYKLTAGLRKKLTNDNENYYNTVIISEAELDSWQEVDA